MTKNAHLAQSEIVEQLPAACADEKAALALFEEQRWGKCPCCVRCGDTNVYTIKDRATGERRADGRWRCRGCGMQFTVRTGQIMEDSPIPLRKWAYAFWAAAASKNGVSALEMSRKIQISYKSALFMMHRIRWAMNGDDTTPLDGTIEADETYVGGKPRHRGNNKRGRGTKKQPVAAVLQRDGEVRTRVIPVVNADNVKRFVRDNVAPTARLMTDQESSYKGLGSEFEGGHHSVNHGAGEYVRGDVTTNGIESFFARVKRGIRGTYHNVSKEHLHRYMAHFEFSHNTRKMNDGERVEALVRSANGKRLMYREAKAG